MGGLFDMNDEAFDGASCCLDLSQERNRNEHSLDKSKLYTARLSGSTARGAPSPPAAMRRLHTTAHPPL